MPVLMICMKTRFMPRRVRNIIKKSGCEALKVFSFIEIYDKMNAVPGKEEPE